MVVDEGNIPPQNGASTVNLAAGVTFLLNTTDVSNINARVDMMTFHHATGGTMVSGTGGFGTGIRFEGPKVNGVFADMVTIEGGWLDPDTTNPYGQFTVYCRRYGVANQRSLLVTPDNARFVAGNIGSPGIAYLADQSSGFYLNNVAGNNIIHAALGGVANLHVSTLGVSFNAVTTPIAASAVTANITNNIAATGTATLADWVGAVYATDAAAIKTACYQLARKYVLLEAAMRANGLVIT